MACDVTTQSFKLEAVNLSFGGEGKVCVTPVLAAATDTYFTFSTPTIKYYVWLNLDSVGTDPALAGYTGIAVDVATGYTVAEYIAAAKLAIEAVGESLVYASNDGLSFRIENYDLGAVLETAVDVDSTFTIVQEAAGFGGALGKTLSGIELTTEVTQKDILSNQTGETPLDSFATGISVSVTADLMEVTAERVKSIIGEGFGDYINTGAEDVVGFGTSKLYSSSFNYAGKLVGHPVRLADNDRSSDFVIWKTVPVMSSIAYSGTDEQALNVEFKALIDSTKSEKLSLATILGDWKADLR